jgi:4,5-dihydroxyphthalate decarboxylase
MMQTLTLSLGLVDACDRTAPIVDGTITVQGADLIISTGSPGDLFRRTTQFAEFDISEMSLSTFIALVSRGDRRYQGLPVFPRRAFRHGFIFINTKSGIQEPQDLQGRKVGVSEHQQTASLWIRGILRDEYGVDTDTIEWHEGGLDVPEDLERLPLKLPASVKLRRLEPGCNLSDMLVAAEIDAIIGPRRPRCAREGHADIQRLIPNYRQVEQDYYRRTGFFPIMHLIVVRTALLERHQWLAHNICEAFERAKQESDIRLLAMAERTCALPWLLDDVEELMRVFGTEHWPYGIAPNRATIEKTIAMSVHDGLATELDPRDLFAEQVRGETVVEFM